MGAITIGRERVTTEARTCVRVGVAMWAFDGAGGAIGPWSTRGRVRAWTTSGELGAEGRAATENCPVSGPPARPWANAAAPATAPARTIAANTLPMPLMLYPRTADNITQTRYRRMGIRP